MDPLLTWVSLFVLVGMGGVAYRLRALDAAGSVVAFLMGVVVLVGLGPGAVAVLLLFAGGGSLISRVGRRSKRLILDSVESERPRGWRNVMGNGAAAMAVAVTGFFLPTGSLVFPFAVAVAVAAADTVASELGCLSRRPVLITRPSLRVPPGTNGGVSWLGTISGIAAAFVIGVAAVLVMPLPWGWLPWVVLAGAAGSLLDSFLGALWEAPSGAGGRGLSKTHVNLIATTVPTVVAYLVAWWIHPWA